MAECGRPTGRGVVTYPCIIEGRDHPGPCSAKELPRTVEARERWEEAQRRLDAERGGEGQGEDQDEAQGGGGDDDESSLDYFQGPAQTTAERHTTGATPPPGQQAEEDSEPEPTKQRPGDQPLPRRSDRDAIQDLVVIDIEERKQVGVERYGTPLQEFNGRSSLRDAYEEALDLTIYLRALIEESQASRETMVEAVTEAIWTDLPAVGSEALVRQVAGVAVDTLLDSL